MPFQDVEGSSRTFFKPAAIGDRVVIKVQMFGPAMAKDFNGNPVPQATGLVTEYSGSQEFEPGDVIKISGGQAQLTSKLLAAQPAEGDLLLVEYIGTYEAAKGPGKAFRVAVDRGAGAVQGELA